MQYPQRLEKLFSLLQKLPGVGRRSSQRYAFDMLLHWPERTLQELAAALNDIKKVLLCADCGCLADESHCLFCQDPMRRRDALCVVGSPREVYTLESTREFGGLYHVLPTLLSPLDGRGEEKLNLPKLIARIQKEQVTELILALDSSLEGDATCLFIKEKLQHLPVKISRLAFGIPVGSALEFVDGGTLARALSARGSF
ncbi:MAG: recombination protein RecR [Verrucomicrobia bacterium]|nr:recombination protein RecR [Verrucomicrobiota bacterium]MBS0636806.1 recombination protein RecR [Verrucomicrobiota bacterium]